MNQMIQHRAIAATAAVADRAAGGGGARVAIVSSSWHREIVACAQTAACDVFAAADPPVAIEVHELPGAFEIPLHAKLLARSGRVDAIVAAAFVVNGGIYRHEFVAQAVIDGLMRVQIETEVPVLSAVLTPRDFHGHAEHERFFREHFAVKGREVAEACLRTLAALRDVRAAA